MLSFMNMSLILRMATIMVLVGFTLGACGVKSSPQYPAGSTYPQQYPSADKLAPVITGSDKPENPLQRRPDSAGRIYQYPNPPSYVPPEK